MIPYISKLKEKVKVYEDKLINIVGKAGDIVLDKIIANPVLMYFAATYFAVKTGYVDPITSSILNIPVYFASLEYSLIRSEKKLKSKEKTLDTVI